MNLTIIPFSDFEPLIIQHLTEDIAFLAPHIVVAESLELPETAYNAARHQYHANSLLNQVKQQKGEHLLGITNADMYVESLNFVFGLAELPGQASIISTSRLHFDASEQVFRDRVVKEAVHELGHTLGLQHCKNAKCVMHFSNSLQDTDNKEKYFCSQCAVKLANLQST